MLASEMKIPGMIRIPTLSVSVALRVVGRGLIVALAAPAPITPLPLPVEYPIL